VYQKDLLEKEKQKQVAAPPGQKTEIFFYFNPF
jgi:hypothetical protein